MTAAGLLRSARALAVPAAILGAAELFVRTKVADSSFAAAPSTIAATLVRLLFEDELVGHAAISLARLFAGVALGAGAGMLSGVLLAESRVLDTYLSPTVRFVAGIPVVLWMPFCILFFGTDEGFKLALLAISTGLLFHTSVYRAITDTERRFMELALLFEKTWSERARLVLLPAVSGPAFMALRASLAFGWVVLFFLEYAAARQGVEGLGWFVANERQLGRIEEEYAALAFLGALAFAVDVAITKIQARVMRWSDKWQPNVSRLMQ